MSLPEVVFAGGVWRLPCAAPTYDGLAAWWAEEYTGAVSDARRCAARRRELLADDPALAMWLLLDWRAEQSPVPASPGVRIDLAWLADRLAAQRPRLCAQALAGPVAVEARARLGRLAKVVSTSIYASRLAAAVAREIGADPGEAFVLGLVGRLVDWRTESWQSRAGVAAAQQGRTPGTELLDDCFSEGAREAVEQALALRTTAGKAERWPLGWSEAFERQHAEDRAAVWAGAGARFAEHWPAIAAALERTRLVNARFSATLQTEKLESLAEFAAGAGHEMNNPLAVISGRAQLLARSEADPERRRELASMHVQAMRVHEMIADLMVFARPPAPKPTACDVWESIEVVVREAEARAAARGARFEARPPGALARVWADRDQLRVAVRACVDNAIEASSPGAVIEITARPSALTRDHGEIGPHEVGDASVAAVEISIADEGAGLSEEARRHAFDPYYSGRAAGRGLGLGLSKSWRIVRQHGGEVTLTPGGKGGTVARIVLPAAM
jgi:signal transduction histidine kinase